MDGFGPICSVCITKDDNMDTATSIQGACSNHPVLGKFDLMLLIVEFMDGDGWAELCHPNCGRCLAGWFRLGWICFGPGP